MWVWQVGVVLYNPVYLLFESTSLILGQPALQHQIRLVSLVKVGVDVVCGWEVGVESLFTALYQSLAGRYVKIILSLPVVFLGHLIDNCGYIISHTFRNYQFLWQLATGLLGPYHREQGFGTLTNFIS